MKPILLATFVTAATMTAAAGFADSMQPATNHNPDMPAITTSETPAAIQPAAGRNSFTEAQAKARLVDSGYTQISALKTDANGVWRGTAKMKNMTHKVAVDYQGNVTSN